ncbi:MAG: SDR family oxidoreductase [Mycobacterium sp.]|nr:SDR family oxidoreductase [Mycobacterium sp.]
MNLDLDGKTVVVTGASRGIGLAITRRFAEEGARVVAGARTISGPLAELATSAAVEPVAVDLAGPDGPGRLIGAAGGRIDVLVNNVGIATPRLHGFAAITDEMWLETFNLDVLATVRAIRAALPAMLGGDGAVIVNIGSVNARLPDPMVVDYSAAKAAFDNLGKALSKEFGKNGIRVNTIDPGPVGTDLWLGADGVATRLASANAMSADDVVSAAAANTVTGRFTTPEEVADLALVLASDRFANITGANIVIDGGMIPTV